MKNRIIIDGGIKLRYLDNFAVSSTLQTYINLTYML